MLPECRTEGDVYAIPKYALEAGDIEGFMEELKGFHGEFSDCFTRQEPRDNFFRYMVGQFSPLERKSIEPIALQLEGAKVRAMQFFVSDAIWDEKKIRSKYRSLVKEDLGNEAGVLVFDETSFVKKGEDSAGVARQYCGTPGKVENCQVGVFAAYASRHGYCLLDGRLFVPEKWFTAEYKRRREKCRFPSDLSFRTKPQLAADMLRELAGDAVLPFRYVVADTVYGGSPDFIEAVEAMTGVPYLVSMAKTTLCWLTRPMMIAKAYRYKGKVRTKKSLRDPGEAPLSFETIARNINSYFWYRRKVSEGTKGPIEYEFTKRRVVLARGGLPGKEVWLVIRRSIAKEPEYYFFISNAPLSTRLKTFVWLSGIRWAIEQCFEETKTELGMDHYEVRKLPGWIHHMLTCILAHFFLWHIKLRLGKKSTSHYSVAA